MNVDDLIRDKGAVHDALTENGELLMATKDLKVYMPKHWASGNLGSMEENVNMVGIFGIVVGNKYACSTACCQLTFTPRTVNTITVDDVVYLELSFPAGAPLFNTTVIKVAPILYEINNEISNKGKTPWYMNLSDIARMFDTAVYHAGAGIGANRAIMEMMGASRVRMRENKSAYMKEAFTKQKDYDAYDPIIIAGRSVGYGATNTSARLLGSNMAEGMSSALVNPSEKLESLEAILLK